MKFSKQVLVILFLLISVPLGIYLIFQTQTIRSRAEFGVSNPVSAPVPVGLSYLRINNNEVSLPSGGLTIHLSDLFKDGERQAYILPVAYKRGSQSFLRNVYFKEPAAIRPMGGRLSLSPKTGVLKVNCEEKVQVLIDTAGINTDGADVILNFDPSVISITAVNRSTFYSQYPSIDNTNGKIYISGITDSASGFSGKGVFAEFTVKTKNVSSSIPIKFDFSSVGNTTDSNIVARNGSYDILSFVDNGAYKSEIGSCSLPPTPTPIPTVTFSPLPTPTYTPSPLPTPTKSSSLPQATPTATTSSPTPIAVTLTKIEVAGVNLDLTGVSASSFSISSQGGYEDKSVMIYKSNGQIDSRTFRFIYKTLTPSITPVITTSPTSYPSPTATTLPRLTFGPGDQGVSKCAYFPRPIRRKSDGACFYSITSCYDPKNYSIDYACDVEDYFDDQGRLWFTINNQPLSMTGVSGVSIKVTEPEQSVYLLREDGSQLVIKMKLASVADEPKAPPVVSSPVSKVGAKATPPEILTASCNRTTLSLSWKEISGIGKYQMRGRRVDPATQSNYYPTLPDNKSPDGSPDPNWTNGLDISFEAKEVLSNSDGSGVSCFSGLCNYTFSGLRPEFNYRVWVNSVDSDGGRSNNSYVKELVSCKEIKYGNGFAPPSEVKASCVDGNIKLTWKNPLGEGIRNHIRGLQTDDPDYFPPNNWTDGIDSARYLSNSGGEGVECSGGVCQFVDPDKKSGTYRVWMDAYQDSSRSDNVYIPGLVNCR